MSSGNGSGGGGPAITCPRSCPGNNPCGLGKGHNGSCVCNTSGNCIC